MILTYGDYVATIELDDEAGVMFGRVQNLSRDGIAFEGESVEDLTQNFHDAVDSYVEACEEEGVEPERPYSGTVNLRMGSELHKSLVRYATMNNISLNEVIVRRLRRVVEQDAEINEEEHAH